MISKTALLGILGSGVVSEEVKAASSSTADAAQAAAPARSAGGQKPNVVFILSDNVGYGDLGPYGGGELRGCPTPRLDQLAREGLRLTQYLVEPACTPSRAALMTGQYSIRNGLSLIIVPGTVNTLPAKAYTMGDMFHGLGYATALFGKWHLGSEPQSLPTAHGFQEFYGIPPDTSWDSCTYVDSIELTHSIPAPPAALLEKGPHIVEAKLGGPLRNVKPFTPEVRAEIDYELVTKSVDFIKRQNQAGKPFFLYLPISMGHAPNLPAKAFAGKSRIGNYGDKMMEVSVDFHMVPNGAGTKLTHTIEMSPKSFFTKLFAPMIRRQIPKQTVAAMESLRGLLAAKGEGSVTRRRARR